MSKDLRSPRGGERKDVEGSYERCELPWWAMMPGGRPPDGWVRPDRKVGTREPER
jgi:hypothetical protein